MCGVTSMKVVLKGIMTAEDAEMAAAAGVAGIVPPPGFDIAYAIPA